MQRVLVTLILVVAFGTLPTLDSGGAAPAPQNPLQPDPVFTTAGGTADSNNRMIAVTGMDITGSSVLFLIDTEQKQLAAYQAVGGSNNSRKVYLVGARRIDYDLQLRGYNDESEYSWRDFAGMFDRIGGGADPDEAGGGSRDLRLGEGEGGKRGGDGGGR